MHHGIGNRHWNRDVEEPRDVLPPVGIHVILKRMLNVTHLGLSIQPGCGCHSGGSAHRRHGDPGPGSAPDGQEAGHREEVTDRGDVR